MNRFDADFILNDFMTSNFILNVTSNFVSQYKKRKQSILPIKLYADAVM